MASSSSSSSRDRVDPEEQKNKSRELDGQISELFETILTEFSDRRTEIPNPPPLPIFDPNLRQRLRTVLTAPPPPQSNIEEDLEAANLLQPAERAHPIPFLGRIRILADGIRIFIVGFFTWVRLLVADVWDRIRIFIAGFYTWVRLLVADIWDRVWILGANFFARISALSFVRYLLKRNEEFRLEEESNEMKPRLVRFQANSTPSNNMLWKFYKWVYIGSAWFMVLCVFAGGCYWMFGEGSGSNPKSFRFKDKSMMNPVLAVVLVSSVVYGCWAYHQWNDFKLFKIRTYHIGFLALDIICDIRSIKTVILTCYGFYDLAKEYGVWTDVIFVGFPVFYSIWSLSILILFQQEFYHAHGLINDFIVIFVGPMMIQFAHGSILNGVLYAIPIVFGRLSKFVGNIYRPHVTDEFYDPTTLII